jgi:serine/threonine protein kinase
MIPLDALLPRWPEISALIDEALALPAGERARWLDSLAGDRAGLKDTLRELLASHARIETGDFLETLPRVVRAEAAALAPGRRIGPYRLIEPIGHGGMGAVWRAERADGAFVREVALKLPLVSHLRQDLAARFERERDILARLAHPRIARLYDAGVAADGLPYLAMEIVEGRPIDAYCDEHRLDLRARIALFLQVLDAVQYAHANLVIHRDLKPSNILVTREGEVRLLDFGIAKLLTDETQAPETELTRASGRLLTPDYASPEQVAGDTLTIATDLYSLGVVLYRLLSGQSPYRVKINSAAQLEEAILTVHPPRPSSVVTAEAAQARGAHAKALSRALSGDLDTIALKAIAKPVPERYATAAQFAQDIERHLRREPIAARPAGMGLRFVRLVQRNRAASAAIAGIFVALTAGLAAALWQAGVAREQVRIANQAVARHEGVRHFHALLLSSIASWDAAAFAEPRAIANLLNKTLEEFEPQYRESPHAWAGILNAALVQHSFLGEPEDAFKLSIRYLEVVKKIGADPRNIALAYVGANRAAGRLGRYEDSERFLRDALASLPVSSDPPLATARVLVIGDLGRVLTRVGKRAEGRLVLEQGREFAARHLPADPHRATLLESIGRFDAGFDDRAALAALEHSQRIYLATARTDPSELSENRWYLGGAYLELGRLEEAEKQLREAHAVDLQLYGQADAETLAVQGALALTLARREHYVEAAAMLSEARRVLQGKAERKYLAMDAALAGRQMQAALLAGDLAAAERAMEMLADAGARDPIVPHGQVLPLARVELLLLQDRVAQAAALLEAWRPTAPPPESFQWQLAEVRLRLARNDAAGAAQRGRELLRAMREAGVVASWTLVAAHEWTAWAAARAGDAANAAALLDAASQARAAVPPPSAVERADSELRQAQTLRGLGRAVEAKQLAQSALGRLGRQHAQSPRVAQARRILGLPPQPT